MSPKTPETMPNDTALNNEPSSLISKRLLCVRHGISVANEFMSRAGNEWGDSTFRDDPELIDARLSETGQQKTQHELPQQLKNEFSHLLPQVELVLISPLSRCLDTYDYGVEKELRRQLMNDNLSFPKVMAIPLLRERVYTASDTGRPASVLAKEFPHVDFDHCFSDDHQDTAWWYTGPSSQTQNYQEWRPYGDGQWYAVPGEPQEVFAERMKELDAWIATRPEKTILIVAHWGVLRHMTNGTEWENAEARLLEWKYCPIQNSSSVEHI